jgi:hypothetical protein
MRTIVILGNPESDDFKAIVDVIKKESKPLAQDDHLRKVTKTDLSKAVVLNEAHPSDPKTFQ